MIPLELAPASAYIQDQYARLGETDTEFEERMTRTYFPYPVGSVNITGTIKAEDLQTGMQVLHSTKHSQTKVVDSITERSDMRYGFAVMRMKCPQTGMVTAITLMKDERWEIAGPNFVEGKPSGWFQTRK